jgi:hypothetical protein
MAINNKTNIGYITQMPDSTLDEMRKKLDALIRAVSEETNYIEQKISIGVSGTISSTKTAKVVGGIVTEIL